MALSALLGLWVGIIRPVKRAALAYDCTSQLRQIAAAIQSYRDANGRYPSSVFRDRAGAPMHSWRAAILPYLSNSALAASYDWTSPWNSDRNLRAARDPRLLSLFRCPASDGNGGTSYIMVTGPPTVENGQRVLIIEVEETPFLWSTPTELKAGTVSLSEGSILRLTTATSHADGAHALLMDGRLVFVKSGIALDDLDYSSFSDTPVAVPVAARLAAWISIVIACVSAFVALVAFRRPRRKGKGGHSGMSSN